MELAPGMPDPLFLHELALELHMTISDIGSRMSASEQTAWAVYFEHRRRHDESKAERSGQRV